MYIDGEVVKGFRQGGDGEIKMIIVQYFPDTQCYEISDWDGRNACTCMYEPISKIKPSQAKLALPRGCYDR